MLYLKDVKREPKDTLATFLERCFHGKGFKAYGSLPTTYKDVECTDKEMSSKHRSFEIIAEVSKTYFRVCEKQVAKTLKKLILKNQNEKKCLGFLLCKSANKWILNGFSAEISNDIWGNKDRFILDYGGSEDKTDLKGSGQYSFDEIEKLMNE